MSFLLEPGITVKEFDVGYLLTPDYFEDMSELIKKIGLSEFLKKVEVFKFDGGVYVKYLNEVGIGFDEPIYAFSYRLEIMFPKEKMKVKVWRFLHEG